MGDGWGGESSLLLFIPFTFLHDVAGQEIIPGVLEISLEEGAREHSYVPGIVLLLFVRRCSSCLLVRSINNTAVILLKYRAVVVIVV